ncbi:uncharacterized protein LOC127796908 [Diospyros lotus]|uniref:uncharacterized protein LOC127796908 n=1 Tax=Diospyros lotus TaxID=55363 RepID=UPI002252F886|nr:uncharacterized protein LOC127796908 [Diospyros lotus]
MDFKVLKWQILRGSIMRRLILKLFLFGLAMAIFPFLEIAHDVRTLEPLSMDFDECPLNFGSNACVNLSWVVKPLAAFGIPLDRSSILTPCKETGNLTINVFKELVENNLLETSARALCVGEGSSKAVTALREFGFSNALGIDTHPFFSLSRKRFVYELGFKDNYFDFVFSKALDRVSVPALLVHEIERVLRPGGTGAMIVGTSNFYSGGLVRAATPVSSFLRSSNIVHVCGIGSFTLVTFEKKLDQVALLEHYRLPSECQSVTNNKPFIKHLEPLEEYNSGPLGTKISYLPKLVNISSRNRLIYINIGAGEVMNSTISELFKPYYPIDPRTFNVYLIDGDASALSFYVKNPGVSFVYYPGLAGENYMSSLSSDEYLSAPFDEEEFDFIGWFERTVSVGDFVVIMMNARTMELKILFELFESGAICHVDEIFLRCSDNVDCKSSACGDCMSLFKGLRNSGIFVHRWLEN